MRIDPLRFNTYLLATLLAVSCGCQGLGSKKNTPTLLRLHIEASPDGTEHTQTIHVNRNSPVKITVSRDSFLDERFLSSAVVVDTLGGGFAIELEYDRHGSWMLESVTSMNPGRRVAVFAGFPETRWLAAPLVQRRISDGRLSFTPDCSREEADRIVKGLKRTIAVVKKAQ